MDFPQSLFFSNIIHLKMNGWMDEWIYLLLSNTFTSLPMKYAYTLENSIYYKLSN